MNNIQTPVTKPNTEILSYRYMNLTALTLLSELIWLDHPYIRWPLTSVYLFVLLMISIYGLHRYFLVILYYRNRHKASTATTHFDTLPSVTIQLPMYNEMHVAQRIIDAACKLKYPRQRLQIQVLDDSTDISAQIAEQRVIYWQQKGLNIQYLHRKNRTGYKAGALATGMKKATGQYIAIFDADFVPQRDFLMETIHYFSDPKIGMVQTCWDHLNRNDSLLTSSQAIFLDGHFIIEHAARNWSHRWINFNGTAGIWRRTAIDDAGGWEHDTLTEDVDLSYRSQLAGWQFLFLPQVKCPAELPPEINAFKAQQHRWTKGSIQVAKKLFGRLLRADIPTKVKIEAFFHLTSPMVYLYVTIMAILFFPALYVNMHPFEDGTFPALIFGMTLFALGTASASVFYIVSQRAQNRSVLATIVQIPVLMSIGIGIAVNNARGVIEALLGHESAFIRTPKYNTDHTHNRGNIKTQVIATPSIKAWMCYLEISMGLYTSACAVMANNTRGSIVSIPFLTLFAAGYFYVGLSGLWSQWLASKTDIAAAVL